MGRSKYIPLSKVAKESAKEHFPAYFQNELDLLVTRPTTANKGRMAHKSAING